jgi:diaminopimelate decarboxylase
MPAFSASTSNPIPELERLNEVAGQCGKQAPISLRVNPNVDPKTHPYISTGLKEAKFGVAYEHALDLYRRAAALPNIAVAGIDCHIGSQLLDPSPFVEALERILALVDQLAAEGIKDAPHRPRWRPGHQVQGRSGAADRSPPT